MVRTKSGTRATCECLNDVLATFWSLEESLCHVAMVAIFLDDNKPKISLKKWIRTVSNFIDLIQFHLTCRILAKLSGVESERTVSEFSKRKLKEISCAVFTNSIKRAREIRKFQVADLQRRLRNVQKSVMHVQSCCFANINLLLFVFVAVAVVVALTPYCCDPEILLPW